MISKEVRQQIKKATKQILYEDKKRKELLNKQIEFFIIFVDGIIA